MMKVKSGYSARALSMTRGGWSGRMGSTRARAVGR